MHSLFFTLLAGLMLFLYGGDPLVFEGLAKNWKRKEARIPTAIEAGIASYTGIAATPNTPTSEPNTKAWVVTDTHARKLSSDIALAAQSTATVVVR